MNLTEKHVAQLTLKMLAVTANMNQAKQCAVEVLHSLAERDAEWINYIKQNYGIEFNFEPIRKQYEEASQVIKKY